MDFLSAIATYFRNGGPFMFIILAVGVVTMGIVLERLWIISRAASLNGGKFAADLENLVERGDLQGAMELSRRVKAPSGKVALHMLTVADPREERLQSAADGAATLVLPPFARRLPHLNTLANVATLLGLMGTIFGLTTAFTAVGAAEASQRSAFLAAGISQALNTTSFGLIVAVPTMIAHGFLVSRVEAIVEQVDEVSVRLIRAMLRRRDAATERAAA